MGQSTSEILEDECLELHLCAQQCRMCAQRLYREKRDDHFIAKQLVQKGEDTQRVKSLLQRVVQKEREALRWETRASQIENLKHKVLVAGSEANVTKFALRISRAIKRATPDQAQLDRELSSLDDDLAAFGAGGREVMEEMEGEEVNVNGMLEQLQDEARLMHDLPFSLITSASSPIGGISTPLSSSGRMR
jgi:hypothetical protein